MCGGGGGQIVRGESVFFMRDGRDMTVGVGGERSETATAIGFRLYPVAVVRDAAVGVGGERNETATGTGFRYCPAAAGRGARERSPCR